LDPYAILIEYVEYGSLGDALQNPEHHFLWILCIKIASNIAAGLQFMHSKNILHRDMKSPNIMLASLDPALPILAKIADFGTSIVLETGSVTGSIVDNPMWLAPEILSGKSYSFSSDVYAFGMICWELIVRKQPFSEFHMWSEIENAVVHGMRPELPSAPKEWNGILTNCWKSQPSERPSLGEITSILSELETSSEEIEQKFHTETKPESGRSRVCSNLLNLLIFTKF